MAQRCALIVVLLSSLLLSGCAAGIAASIAANSGNSSGSQASVESFTQLGIRYLQARDTVSAKAALQKALSIDDDYAPALNGLALVFQAEREPELAEQYFKEAIAADSSSAMVHNNYGAFLYAQQRFDEACNALARATEDPFYPQRAQAFENLGLCYRLVGKEDAAEFVLDRALTLSPDRPVALIEMADINLDRGQMNLAATRFQRFRTLIDAGQASHTAKSLWVGVRVARHQGSASRAATYALLLKNQYPNSQEYKNYTESGR